MPLLRIRAAFLEQRDTAASPLRFDALDLAQGRTLLNRRVREATALIVVRGRLRVATEAEDALLAPGEGVLLPADTVYSLRAEDETRALLAELPNDWSLPPDA